MSYFSDVYMSFILICDGYGIKNKGLTMDWDDNPAHASEPIKTSFPILFISNSADPVVSAMGETLSISDGLVIAPSDNPSYPGTICID
jgi:hypothetical protein